MSFVRCRLRVLIVFGLLGSVGAPVASAATPLDIVVSFAGGISASQQAVFSAAEAFWEAQLVGYQPGVTLAPLVIDASGIPIDGAGGVLGQAGPGSITFQSGYVLATTGLMEFDSADLGFLESSGRLLSTILHEMGHVLGLGTLWQANGLYVSGSGQYTGTSGLAAWVAEFGQTAATSVPVELGGGSGTADGHWDEVDGGGGLTGFTDAQGRDLRDALMTGWLSASAFVSQTTLGSFRDLGFLAPLSVPEPELAILLGLAGLWLLPPRQSARVRARSRSRSG